MTRRYQARHCKLCVPRHLLAYLALSHPQAALAAGEWVPIYDGRSGQHAAMISKTDEAILRSQALPNAAREMQGGVAEFEIRDKAQGSFTRKGVLQKLFLYKYVQSARNQCTNGLVVVQSGKVVWHWAYAGACDTALKCLPDINNDGRNEVAIVSDRDFQGYVTGTIAIVELLPDDVLKLGMITVGQDNSASEDSGKETVAFQISVRPGKKPQFQSTKYKKVNNKWLCSGKPSAIKPEEQSVDFFEI